MGPMRWIGVGVAVVALAVAAVGCGSSNDSGSEAAADTAVTETSASTEETSTEATSTEETSTEADDLSGLTGECKDLAEAGQAFGAAIANSGGGGEDLDATAAAYKAFAEQAPDELKDDFEVLAELMADYANALGDIDLQSGETPTPAQLAKLAALGQSLSTEKAQKASTAISTWAEENCGTP